MFLPFLSLSSTLLPFLPVLLPLSTCLKCHSSFSFLTHLPVMVTTPPCLLFLIYLSLKSFQLLLHLLIYLSVVPLPSVLTNSASNIITQVNGVNYENREQKVLIKGKKVDFHLLPSWRNNPYYLWQGDPPPVLCKLDNGEKIGEPK